MRIVERWRCVHVGVPAALAQLGGRLVSRLLRAAVQRACALVIAVVKNLLRGSLIRAVLYTRSLMRYLVASAWVWRFLRVRDKRGLSVVEHAHRARGLVCLLSAKEFTPCFVLRRDARGLGSHGFFRRLGMLYRRARPLLQHYRRFMRGGRAQAGAGRVLGQGFGPRGLQLLLYLDQALLYFRLQVKHFAVPFVAHFLVADVGYSAVLFVFRGACVELATSLCMPLKRL